MATQLITRTPSITMPLLPAGQRFNKPAKQVERTGYHHNTWQTK